MSVWLEEVKKLARVGHPEGEGGGMVGTRGRGQQPQDLSSQTTVMSSTTSIYLFLN